MFRQDYVVTIKLDSRLFNVVVECAANAREAEALARKRISELGKSERYLNDAVLVMIRLDEEECKRIDMTAPFLHVRSESILKPVVYRDAEDNLTVGFLHRHTDTLIDDPELSSCGRFRVDPRAAYGVDETQINWMLELKTHLKRALTIGPVNLARILNTDQVRVGELNTRAFDDAIAVAFAELHGIEHQIGD